jgi:hypothetical protein
MRSLFADYRGIQYPIEGQPMIAASEGDLVYILGRLFNAVAPY